jgi:hypothetical protein
MLLIAHSVSAGVLTLEAVISDEAVIRDALYFHYDLRACQVASILGIFFEC